MRMYELEVHFYRDCCHCSTAWRTPACYLAELDEDTGGFTLVLEDLSARTDPVTCSPRAAGGMRGVLGELAGIRARPGFPAHTGNAVARRPQRTVQIFDSMSAGLDPFLAASAMRWRPSRSRCSSG